jgi:soluble cytochrome b562
MLEEYEELIDARGKAELNKEIKDYKQSLQEADDAICESIDEFLNKSRKDSTAKKTKKAAKSLSDLNNKRLFTPNKDYRFSTVSIKN